MAEDSMRAMSIISFADLKDKHDYAHAEIKKRQLIVYEKAHSTLRSSVRQDIYKMCRIYSEKTRLYDPEKNELVAWDSKERRTTIATFHARFMPMYWTQNYVMK